MLSYSAREASWTKDQYKDGRLTNIDYFPPEYASEYEDFAQHNLDGKTDTFTLVVYKGEARAYFTSAKNNKIAVWSKLPDDYAGGMVGLFMGAHTATYTSIKIADLSDSATPMTNKCKFEGATCDSTVGLCLGGPTLKPTSSPSAAPTFMENCQDPQRHPASEACPNPVGGNAVTYDTSDASVWDFVDQEPLGGTCNWVADATGLSETTGTSGTSPSTLLLIGCLALIPDSYTDFVAEFDAVHFDNDAWGFVFGYNDALDHYTAFTHNDNWPLAPIDGVKAPFTKIRKSTGLPCQSPNMNASNSCK